MSAAAQATSFDELRDLYQRAILERGRAPRHGRRLDAFDATASGDNPMCGDRCAVFVRRDAGRVAEVGFEARGCAISVASADLMAEAVVGLSRAEANTRAEGLRRMVRVGHSIDAALAPLKPLSGVHEFPSRIKCAMLPWDALLAALAEGEPA